VIDSGADVVKTARMNGDRQSVTLTKPQANYLREEAAKLGISMSDLIRRIIDQHRS
jgi:predicted DNA-binding ribbon-helix-helix protein